MATSSSAAAQGSQHKPRPPTEREKWSKSTRRWRITIVPEDDEFQERLDKFQEDLAQDSVHNILVRDFSHHEIKKFESGYLDKKRYKAIYDGQKRDAEAYKAKLATPPFEAVSDNVKSSLAFKLTMMYFGFPVEPMRFTDPLNLSGPFANLGFTSLFEDDDEDDEDEIDDDLAFVPEELRPLRFLNYYDKRGYGKDNSHMNPEKTYELYYGIPMMVPSSELESTVSLRGGGGSVDDEDDSEDDQPSIMGIDEDDVGDDDDEDLVMTDIRTSRETDEAATLVGPSAVGVTTSQTDETISLRGGSGREGIDASAEQTGPARRQETAEERAARTTGPEEPISLDHYHFKPRSRLTYGVDGYPDRGQRIDDFAKGKLFREWSYGHPLSVSMKGQHPAIPINAPPLERILRTPGRDGLPSDSIPVVSTQVLTVTEQRELQEAFFRMRTIALDRAQPCPYEGCLSYYPVDKEGMVAFRAHLKDAHVSTKCPFCSEPLFAYYDDIQIQEHFVTNHADHFSRKGDLRRDTDAHTPHMGYTHRREEQWSFCARCGRNHRLLNIKADRANHDNRCYPQLGSDELDISYCGQCGEEKPARGSEQRHVCVATAEERQDKVFCRGCALPAHVFSRVYGHKHLAHCRGVGRKRADWCPWCGIYLQDLGAAKAHDHLEHCVLKPATGEGPIDTSTGLARDSPRDDPLRVGPLVAGRGRGQVLIALPSSCPFERCRADGLEWREHDGEWLAEHFRAGHGAQTLQGSVCPLCDLDFRKRRFITYEQKVAHFEDHVHERVVRIMADRMIAESDDWSDPTIQACFRQRENDAALLLQRVAELEDKQLADQETIMSLLEHIQQLGETQRLYATSRQPSSPQPPRPSSTALGKRPATRRDAAGTQQRVEGQPSSRREAKRTRTTRSMAARDPTYKPPAHDTGSDSDDFVRVEGEEQLYEGSDYSNSNSESEQAKPSAPAAASAAVPSSPPSTHASPSSSSTAGHGGDKSNKNNKSDDAATSQKAVQAGSSSVPQATEGRDPRSSPAPASVAASTSSPRTGARGARASPARSSPAARGRGRGGGRGRASTRAAAARAKGRLAASRSGSESEGEGEGSGEAKEAGEKEANKKDEGQESSVEQ